MKEVVQFLKEVRVELSRVVWPDFNEFIGATIVVLILITCFAIYLGIVDLGISRVAGYIFKSYGLY